MTHYTQSSVLRNTETASTHQFVSYLNAFPRCDPSMPKRPCCRFQGGSPEVIAFPGSEPFLLMRFLAPPHQWFLKLAFLKTELWV
jgi:hypothetical protein